MAARLVIWDVDGTLIDSADEIASAVALCFADEGIAAPTPVAVRAIIGLTLPVAFDHLHPGLDPARIGRMVDGYRAHFNRRRDELGVAPLFPGIRQVLDTLATAGETHLAVATGKSRQSLMPILDGHGLTELFASIQVSDDHPSKPHPSMLLAAMAELDVGPASTVMVGDTSFDMDMARAAGVAALGVGWGYHAAERLAADLFAQRAEDLPGLIERLTGG